MRIAKLSNNALFQSVDDEMVILDSLSGEYYTLDSIGTFIIENLDKGITLAELVQLGLKIYEVSEDEFKNDSLELIENMVNKGLLELV